MFMEGLDDARIDAATDIFKALGNRHRVAIVCELAEASHCVHELVDALGLKQSLVSQHLRVLRTSGILSTARRGQEVVYSLEDAHVLHMVKEVLNHVATR